MKTKNKQCEYVGWTGRRICPHPATKPLKLNGHPIMWYCPTHAKEIHGFLTTNKAYNNQRANTTSAINRAAKRAHRRQRLQQILTGIQPATSGQLTAYAKALETSVRTIREDLAHLQNTGVITSHYKNTGAHGRTREWTTISRD